MIDGMDKLFAVLRDLEKLDFTDALHAGGDVLLDGAQRRVRVDSGELWDSLQVAVEKNTAVLETDNDHAASNEFGTHQMSAQSFMRAAVDEDGKDAIAALATVLGRQIGGVGR